VTLESAHRPATATKRENRQVTRSAVPVRSATPGDRMAAVVSRIGNWNANALLRDRAIGAPACPADVDRPVGVQAKLSMSRPGDPDEREADRIADQIMASSQSVAAPSPCPTCAASGSSCPKCREDKKIQRTAVPGVGQGSGAPALGLGGAGVPLDAPIRAFFEPHFGVDLANVRVHTDDAADRATSSIGARAFTLGSDIAFARNEFAPETTNGKHLVAHELTHVIQQSQAASPNTSAQQPLRPQLTSPPKVQGAWYDFAVDAAEWVGGEVAEGAEAVWGGAKRVGGWVKDEAARVGGAAWECFKATGSSIGDLMTGHLPNPRQLLNLPEPADDSPIGVMDVIMALLQHPCVRMIPGYPVFAAAASKLPDVYAFLKGAWAIVKDPDRITSAIQGALAPMMSDVAGRSREQVESALALSPALRKHLAGIWRHFEPKLLEFGQNWWGMLKQSAWDLLWPWDGFGGDLAAIWETLKKTGSDIWAFDIDSAADDILALWREANQMIGRLYGWFAIASILIGAIIGAFFGGAGAIPGAMLGAEFAMAVGEGLLISTVAAEGLTITKAVYDLAAGKQSDEKNEADYERIANSSIVLGITGALVLLGAIAARFARGVISRVAGKFWPRAAEIPVPEAPRPAEPAPRPAEPAPGAPRPTEPAPVPEGEPARPAEADRPVEGPPTVRETPSADGQRDLQIKEDGRCEVCASPCADIRAKYEAELAADPQLAAELDATSRMTDVDAQAAEYKRIEQKLADQRSGTSATPGPAQEKTVEPETDLATSRAEPGKLEEPSETKSPEQKAAEQKAKMEKLKADREARLRKERLDRAYEEAEQKAHKEGKNSAYDDVSPDNREWIEQSPRQKELAYDPAHRGWTDGSVSEAKAMLDAEQRGLVDPPLTRNLDNTSDFNTPRGEVDHFGPRALDPEADANALVGKLTLKTYDVYLDAEKITPTQEDALIAKTEAKLAAEGKSDLIKKVISSRKGRLK
jgi:hypothetical protein